MRASLALLTLLIAATAALAEEAAPAAANADQQEFKRLVAELNNDDYDRREAAAEQLVDAGPAAVPALVEGLACDQAEVAWRSGAALEQIAVSGDEQTLAQIARELEAAAKRSQRSGLKNLAADLNARQRAFRRERASARIAEHGGRLMGGEFGFDGGAVDPFGGGMVLMDGPVMVEELAVPVDAGIIEGAPVLVPPAADEDLLAGLAKAIARALVPAVEDRKEAEPKADEVERAIEKAPVEAVEKGSIETTEPATIEGSKPPPIAEPAVAEPPIAPMVEEVAIAVVEDVAMAADEGLTPSAQLYLDRSWRGGDDALAALADLPEIGQVTLNDAPITDKALAHLAKLPRLGMVQVRGGKLSRDALLKFHGAKPTATLYCMGEAMMGVNADFGGAPMTLTAISAGSGAADAGLREGDIIHEVDGVKVRDFSDLTICVSTRKAGDKIKVVYERDGKKQTCEVTLTRRTGMR